MAVIGRKHGEIGVLNSSFLLDGIFSGAKFRDVPQPGAREFQTGDLFAVPCK
jgi:hypothetical protein